MHESTAAPNGASGARSTTGSMSERWRSGPPRVHWRMFDVYVDGPKEPVDGNHIGDAPVLPDLLSQIPADEEIGSGEPRER